ncbi:hypothetical protein ACO7_490022 [Thiomonas arsenitoxydans]|nr:hypothetical protein ACO7_490022 [Thiomonas arsenitoxydans]CQR36317.1 hypothetical protein ACO3_490022 [Thiomonas arsenitoxydans]CQR37624.1 hypothetical protein THICB6_40149 [Thiomonas arsenitoxydans]
MPVFCLYVHYFTISWGISSAESMGPQKIRFIKNKWPACTALPAHALPFYRSAAGAKNNAGRRSQGVSRHTPGV